MAKWWRITNQGNKTAEVQIYGTISDEKFYEEDVTPSEFKAELDALGDIDLLNVHINSPGGSVFAGFTLYNILKRHPASVATHVDGMAASIASVVLQAADERVMATNGMVMIHNPMAIALGYAEDMRKVADDLDKIREPIVKSYSDRASVSDDEIKTMMDAETWMTAEEAVEKGFADTVDESTFASATAKGGSLVVNGMTFDVARFNNFDASRFTVAASPAPPPQQDPEPPKPADPIDYSEYETALQNTQEVLDRAQ